MSGKYFCSNCGAVLESNVKFCAHCGASTTGQQAPPQPVQPVQPVHPTPQYTSPQPYAPAQPMAYVQTGVSPLNRTVALILCILLGGIGAHQFYAGKVGTGLVYLLFCWTFIPFFLAFIDFIVILNGTFRDDKGLPLSQW